MPNWVTAELDAQIANGKIKKANTLGGLETLCGIRPNTLETTSTKYNDDLRNGKDTLFFKDVSVMQPIATPPYYAVEIHPAIVCFTATGLRINDRAQVLNQHGNMISGLYAAGETTGDVMGERYIGGGASIANAIVFGTIAGRNAATDAQRKHNE